MSYCTNDILTLASEIYSDIGSPSNLSIGYISGYLTSSGTLGDLNNKLGTSFYLTGADPCICDPFAAEESAIVELMFMVQYYQQQALAAMLGGNSFWTRLSEGDTTVVRASAVQISQQYLALQKEAQRVLRLGIHDYALRLSLPQSVETCRLYSFPPA